MLAVTVLLCSLLSATASGQTPTPKPKPDTPQASQSTPPSRRQPPSDSDDSPANPASPAKLLKYQHEDAMKDIEKLVKLVGEVQEEIEKAGENVLPLNTLKKLDEVERLSRKIRGKIKQ